MNSSTAAPPTPPAQPAATPAAPPRGRLRSSLLAHGTPMVWLHGGALAVCLFMIAGLLVLVFVQGLNTFWPGPVIQVKTHDGATYLGEVTREDTYRPETSAIEQMPEDARAYL